LRVGLFLWVFLSEHSFRGRSRECHLMPCCWFRAGAWSWHTWSARACIFYTTDTSDTLSSFSLSLDGRNLAFKFLLLDCIGLRVSVAVGVTRAILIVIDIVVVASDHSAAGSSIDNRDVLVDISVIDVGDRSFVFDTEYFFK